MQTEHHVLCEFDPGYDDSFIDGESSIIRDEYWALCAFCGGRWRGTINPDESRLREELPTYRYLSRNDKQSNQMSPTITAELPPRRYWKVALFMVSLLNEMCITWQPTAAWFLRQRSCRSQWTVQGERLRKTKAAWDTQRGERTEPDIARSTAELHRTVLTIQIIYTECLNEEGRLKFFEDESDVTDTL